MPAANFGLNNAVHDCAMRLRHDVRIDVDSVREDAVCDGLERAKSVRRMGKRSVRGNIVTKTLDGFAEGRSKAYTVTASN